MSATPKRKRARLNIQKEKNREMFLYIQKAGHFAKIKTIYVTFIYKKARHFTLRDFL